MKTLSLVDCVELKFYGSVLKNAICFGDCDNDGYSELILGNSAGEISIYRDSVCVGNSTDLGTISAIAVGDLLNIGKNVLVVVTIEGWCHIFDVTETSGSDMGYSSVPHRTEKTKQEEPDIPECSMIWPFHSQRIPPNTKTLHLGDVNEDGLVEMIVGLTDRVLRTYQWRTEPVFDYQQDEKNLSKSDEKDDDTKSESSEVYDGRLIGVNKWEFANQIGSVALHKQDDKFHSILVGQPGGSVAQIIDRSGRSGRNSQSNQLSSTASSGTTNDSGSTIKNTRAYQKDPSMVRNESPSENITILYHPLDVKHMQNPNISTEVAGNVLSTDGENCNSYGVATLDGTIMIARDDTIETSLQVDNQILSIYPVNGKIFACSWNGDTYMIDQSREPIRYHFQDSVAAFVAGKYAFRGDNFSELNKLTNKNCLAFVTFEERVYVYPIE